jgi:hypothetical protein
MMITEDVNARWKSGFQSTSRCVFDIDRLTLRKVIRWSRFLAVDHSLPSGHRCDMACIAGHDGRRDLERFYWSDMM